MSVRIGAWVLDAHHNELRREGETVRLEPKVIQVLAHLARHPGTAVPREELLSVVWPGVIVGDDALTQAIIKLRKALGDDAHKPAYIETISKRGYRLIAPVEVLEPAVPHPEPRIRRRLIPFAGVAAAAIVALIAIGLGASSRLPWPLGTDPKVAAAPDFPTVAVLPLANLSGDPRREYFSDGVTEDLIAALGRFESVRVMSPNAVQAFKGKAGTPQAIRDALHVRYIVQGSVREEGPRLRVAIALSDSERGTQLWSEQYEGDSRQLFEIQDRIVRTIAGKLQVRLSQLEQERALAKPVETLEAHDLLLRARYLISRVDRVANREARALLVRAAQLAPDYGEVYTAQAAAEFQRATEGFVEDAAQATDRAEELAKRTLGLGDLRAHVRAHTQLAAIYGHQQRHEEALANAERALELNPSDAGALYWGGGALMGVGRLPEAIAMLETARRFDPQPSPGKAILLSIAYYVVGRHADSLMQTNAALARHPRNVYLHAIRAAALAQLGRPEEAAQAADDVRRSNPAFRPDNFGTRFADPKYAAMVQDGLRKAGL